MRPLSCTLTADRGDAGRRLDLVVCRHMRGVSVATRTRVQRWIEDGLVCVNGAAVHRPASRAALGDVVTVSLSAADAPPPRAAMAAEPIPLHLVYEDEHIIAVDKPPGMVVHPTYKHMHGTLVNALLSRAPAGTASQHPSIVGRLDKDTSGLVIAAKGPVAHAAFQRTLASPLSKKHYLAVVHGRVRSPRGTIDLGLARDPHDRRRMVASVKAGAPSTTEFERLARSGDLTLLRCRLLTGRMHQIRVHLAACGWPLVGDAKYATTTLPAPHPFPRQALHAWRLSFVHPMTHRPLRLEAPVPDDLAALLSASGLIMRTS